MGAAGDADLQRRRTLCHALFYNIASITKLVPNGLLTREHWLVLVRKLPINRLYFTIGVGNIKYTFDIFSWIYGDLSTIK